MIRASLRLIVAKGPRGFTLREAARLVGVTHAASYRHFQSKAALLAAVSEEGFRALTQYMDRAVARATDPLLRFQQVGFAYVHFAVDHPAHFRVMFGDEATGAQNPSLQQAKDSAFDRVVAEIVAGQRQLRLRPGSPTELALPAWAMVHGLAMLLVDRSPRLQRTRLTAGRLAAIVTTTLMNGIALRNSGDDAERAQAKPRRASRRGGGHE